MLGHICCRIDRVKLLILLSFDRGGIAAIMARGAFREGGPGVQVCGLLV